jgi:hypothetical protein
LGKFLISRLIRSTSPKIAPLRFLSIKRTPERLALVKSRSSAADRQRNRKDTYEVNLLNNILPQHEKLNSPVWSKIVVVLDEPGQ